LPRKIKVTAADWHPSLNMDADGNVED
jgi:hypothetical protein